MRSENQPLLEKEGSGSNNGSRNSAGEVRSGGGANPDALSLDMPGQVPRRVTTGSTASSGVGIDIRYSPGTGPGLGGGGIGAGGGGPYDHPTASFQRFLGPLSLPATPPYESGPLLHYQQRDFSTSYQQQLHPSSSPIMRHAQTAAAGLGSPRPRAGA